MNLTKLILIGGVALVGAIASPVAQARDHDRHRDRDHRDHHDRYEYRHHHHRHYHSGYYRRGVIEREAYYSRPAPRTQVTIAVGGHRHHRR